MVLVTIAATAGTLPVVLYHFYGFNPLSMFHNLIAVPLMCTIATPLSLAGIIVPFGDTLLRLAGMIIEFTIVILERINWGYIYPVIRPSLTEAIIYLIAAVSLIYIRKRLVRFAFFALVLPIALITAGIACHDRFDNKELCIHYIDVGLGDAMLIEAPHGIEAPRRRGRILWEQFRYRQVRDRPVPSREEDSDPGLRDQHTSAPGPFWGPSARPAAFRCP